MEYKSFKNVFQYYFKQIHVLNAPDKKLAQALEAKRRVDAIEGKYFVIAK